MHLNKQKSRVWHQVVVVLVLTRPGLLRKSIFELKSLLIQIADEILKSLLAVSKAESLYAISWSATSFRHSPADRSFDFLTLVRACWKISNPSFLILLKLTHRFIRLMLQFYCRNSCYLQDNHREKGFSWNHERLFFNLKLSKDLNFDYKKWTF